MLKYVYIGILLWIFVPLFCFFLFPATGAFFKNVKVQLFTRKLVRICLGLPGVKKNDGELLYQFGKLDCGEIALKNAMKLLEKKEDYDFKLPENSSMKDIHDVAVRYGFCVKGIKETTLESIDAKINDLHVRVLALIKVYYPFNGFWVYPTRIFMKLMTSNADAMHWIIIENVTAGYVEIIDPYYGRIRISRRNFEDVWNGVIITIGRE